MLIKKQNNTIILIYFNGLMMAIKTEIGFDPFLEFLFGAEEDSEDTEEVQEELDSGCDYTPDESICLDPDSDSAGSDGETVTEFTVISSGKANSLLLEIYTRNTEELLDFPNKGCHNSVSKSGKKAISATKKTKKVFFQKTFLKNKAM